ISRKQTTDRLAAQGDQHVRTWSSQAAASPDTFAAHPPPRTRALSWRDVAQPTQSRSIPSSRRLRTRRGATRETWRDRRWRALREHRGEVDAARDAALAWRWDFATAGRARRYADCSWGKLPGEYGVSPAGPSVRDREWRRCRGRSARRRESRQLRESFPGRRLRPRASAGAARISWPAGEEIGR